MSCSDQTSPIRVTRGADKTLLFTVYADTTTGDLHATIAGIDQAARGSIVDLTGAKVWFTVKNRLEDAGAAVSKRNVTAGGVDGQAKLLAQSGTTKGQFNVFLTPPDSANLDPEASFVVDTWVELAPQAPALGKRYQVVANRQFIVDPTVTTTFT